MPSYKDLTEIGVGFIRGEFAEWGAPQKERTLKKVSEFVEGSLEKAITNSGPETLLSGDVSISSGSVSLAQVTADFITQGEAKKKKKKSMKINLDI